MYFPIIKERPVKQEAIQQFRGYNHTYTCTEGQFYDMQNMSSDNFPALSVRNKRTQLRSFTNLQGILTTNDHIVWIDNGILYVDSEAKTFADGITLSAEGVKTIAKLNSQIIIYPDKVWYDISDDASGTIEQYYTYEAPDSYIKSDVESKRDLFYTCFFSYARESGKVRTIYGQNASFSSSITKISTISDDNTFSLSVDGVTKVSIDTEYIQIVLPYEFSALRANAFKAGDFVKIKLKEKAAPINGLFIDEEKDGTWSFSTQIVDADYYERNYEERGRVTLTFKGKLPKSYILTNNTITIERTSPDMSYIIESNNRLWGCSADGHHIYGSKLGDATVWNSFEGISTDAWETAIGSDGEFTGAISYNGFPHFFKEDRLIRITVSSIGAHQIKEILCRGVQKGCASSLVDVAGTLIYKSPDCICGYSGAIPVDISHALGNEHYTDASAGVIFDKYYISMKHISDGWHIFTYDTKNAIWSKFDPTQASFFCAYKNDLLFCSDNTLYSIKGNTELSDSPIKEKDVEWYIESPPIGFYTADHKYLKKVNIRLTLDTDSTVTLYTKYDMGEWEEQYNINGTGTKLNTLPIIPQRCDHFRWKLVGTGDCIVHSVFKTIEEGSDKI